MEKLLEGRSSLGICQKLRREKRCLVPDERKQKSPENAETFRGFLSFKTSRLEFICGEGACSLATRATAKTYALW